MIGIGTLLQTFREKKSWLPLAALVILLACIGLSVGYFINKGNSSDESSQNQIAQPIFKPDTNLTQAPRVLVLPTPELSELPDLENVEEAKTKPVSTRVNVERKEIVEELVTRAEIIEKPKSLPAPIETTRPTKVQTSRRSEPQKNSQSRPRAIVYEPVPDIESIFTGRSSNGRNQRVRYQGGNKGQMSHEEWKEMQRERKRERKQSRKGSPFPF